LIIPSVLYLSEKIRSEEEETMKKILIMALVVVFGLELAGCNREPIETTAVPSSSETSIPTEPQEEDIFRVHVILNVEKESVELFEQEAKEAVKGTETLLEVHRGQNQKEWNEAVKAACENGADLIVGASPEIADAIAEYAPEYPEIRFSVLEAEVNEPNVQSYYLEYEDAFFEAGMAAASVGEDAVIGWIGGMNIPIIHTFFEAYEQGAKTVNPEIQVLEAYVGGWNEPEKARETALRLAEQGADVVAFVAADSCTGIVEVLEESGVYMIGMTQDCKIEENEWILGAVEEYTDRIAVRMIEDGVQENFDGGTIQALTQSDGMVGFSGVGATSESLDKAYKAY